MDKLIIKDINKIKIYKVKYWCLYFKYDEVPYMIRHISDCGDHWNELTNKNTLESICSDYTLFDIDDFLRLKYKNKKGYNFYYINSSNTYNHIDLEYFVKGLIKNGFAILEQNNKQNIYIEEKEVNYINGKVRYKKYSEKN